MTCASCEEEHRGCDDHGPEDMCLGSRDGCSVGMSQIPGGTWGLGETSTGEIALGLGLPQTQCCVFWPMTRVRWKQRIRAGRLPGSHGDGGSHVVVCWRQVAKSRRHLGADIYLARLSRGNGTPGRGSVYAQAQVGRERSMCGCNQDTSGWLSYGKRKCLYLEAGAEPRGAL